MSHLLATGHGDGYAFWLLGRWMWHRIGWYAIPVTTVAALLYAFVTAVFQDRYRR